MLLGASLFKKILIIVRVPIAQLSYMSFLMAVGDQSTLTNVQAACDVGGAMCCVAPSSF